MNPVQGNISQSSPQSTTVQSTSSTSSIASTNYTHIFQKTLSCSITSQETQQKRPFTFTVTSSSSSQSSAAPHPSTPTPSPTNSPSLSPISLASSLSFDDIPSLATPLLQSANTLLRRPATAAPNSTPIFDPHQKPLLTSSTATEIPPELALSSTQATGNTSPLQS